MPGKSSSKLWCFYYMQGEEGESMECLNAFSIDFSKIGTKFTGDSPTNQGKILTLRLLLHHFPPLLAWKKAYQQGIEVCTKQDNSNVNLPLNPLYHFRLRQKDSHQGYLWSDISGKEEDLDNSISYIGNVIYLKVLPLQNCLDETLVEETKMNIMQKINGKKVETNQYGATGKRRLRRRTPPLSILGTSPYGSPDNLRNASTKNKRGVSYTKYKDDFKAPYDNEKLSKPYSDSNTKSSPPGSFSSKKNNDNKSTNQTNGGSKSNNDSFNAFSNDTFTSYSSSPSTFSNNVNKTKIQTNKITKEDRENNRSVKSDPAPEEDLDSFLSGGMSEGESNVSPTSRPNSQKKSSGYHSVSSPSFTTNFFDTNDDFSFSSPPENNSKSTPRNTKSFTNVTNNDNDNKKDNDEESVEDFFTEYDPSQQYVPSTSGSPFQGTEGERKVSSSTNSPVSGTSGMTAEEINAEEEAVKKQLNPTLDAWCKDPNGKIKNVRILLSTLNSILPNHIDHFKGWNNKPVSMGDLFAPNRVKFHYRKAMLVLHPDKNVNGTVEQKVIAEYAFTAVNESYNKFALEELN